MITVLAVNYDSSEFARILVETVRGQSPVVIVDNSCRSQHIARAKVVDNTRGERTHGEGLNVGLKHVETDFVLILDIDCHLLTSNWKDPFLRIMEVSDCVTVQGPPQKPIRPACVFMRTKDAAELDWRATPGYRGHRITPEGFDVGILAYRSMVSKGFKIAYMDVVKPSRYGTINGEEYGLGGTSLCYHHWHGAHTEARTYDYPGIDLVADKQSLFHHFRKIKTSL